MASLTSGFKAADNCAFLAENDSRGDACRSRRTELKIEHVAFNVEDPLAMGRWYVEHLGFRVKRRTVEPPYAHFLADDSETVMIEIYKNDQASVPDYHSTNPLVLHLALVSDDIESDVRRLTSAGATLAGEIQVTPQGDQLAMLRDPWGFAIQLVKRQQSMI